MQLITWKQFEDVELRVGTIVEVIDFPEARKIDFGPEIGIRWSSAQITVLYTKEALQNRQIVAVVNFPEKQIANFKSQCLVTGFADADGNIVLTAVERPVPNGTKIA